MVIFEPDYGWNWIAHKITCWKPIRPLNANVFIDMAVKYMTKLTYNIKVRSHTMQEMSI